MASTRVIRTEEIRPRGTRTLRFEGADHGSTVSFFLVNSAPGEGPALHRHPYDETWTVLEGEATLVIGDTTLTTRGGDTAVAPANSWHCFTNTGTGTLRVICIHASPVMIQEFASQP